LHSAMGNVLAKEKKYLLFIFIYCSNFKWRSHVVEFIFLWVKKKADTLYFFTSHPRSQSVFDTKNGDIVFSW